MTAPLVVTVRQIAFLTGIAVVGPIAGCAAREARSCVATSACSAGEACVVGVCTADVSTVIVPPSGRLVVLLPRTTAVVLSTSAASERPHPSNISLGAAVGVQSRMLLRFPKVGWSENAIAKAYLVLDPVEGAMAGPGDVTVRVERIVEPWSLGGTRGTSWASPPLSEHFVNRVVRADTGRLTALRIDVTDYAIALTKSWPIQWGVKVEGSGVGYGLPIATGFGNSAGPRLEVYFR